MPNAKRKTRKRDPNFVAIPVSVKMSLSTLADETLLGATLLGATAEDLFVISCDLQWGLRGHATGEGPIEVGLAHGELSDAEVEEFVEVSFLDPNNILAKERARRPVRRAGIFPGLSSEEVLPSINGNKVRTRVKFHIGEHGLRAWAYNHSGAALAGSDVITIQGTIFGRWHR